MRAHHLGTIASLCLAFVLAATATTTARTNQAARQAQEKQLEIEQQAADKAGEDFAPIENKLRADHADEMRAAEKKAEAFKNSRGERGLTPVTVEKSDIVFDDETQSYEMHFHYEIEYRNRLGEPQKVAIFDQQGNLVSFTETSYSTAEQAVRAHTPRTLTDRHVNWIYATDANGQSYPAQATVYGREGEDGAMQMRVKLRFNEDGTPYEGETYGPDGKRNGGFIGKDDMQPKVGDPKGTLAEVPVPRIVTQPCPKCRDLAERRNAIAHEATQLARLLNDTAREHRTVHDAAAKVGRPSQAAVALRLKYETNLPRYQQLMAELDAAHAEFMECQKTCVPPQDLTQGVMPQTALGANDTYVSVAPSFFFGDWQGPRFVYLGLENAALEQTFNVEGLKRSDGFAGADFHFVAGLSPASAIHFGVNTYDVSFSGVGEMLDPLGQDLLFPGVTTPGFSLIGGVAEGTPGGFNVVENMRYHFNEENVTLYGAYSQACQHGPFTFIGYGGASYTRAQQRQTLRGDIPGYLNSFEYDTRFDTDVVRATLGARTIYQVPDWRSVSFYGGATAFVNFADTEGRDSFSLSPVFQDLDIGKNETSFSWSVGLGAEWKLGGALSLFGEGRYTDDDTTPAAVREDDGPSHAEFRRSTAFTGRFGGRFTF